MKYSRGRTAAYPIDGYVGTSGLRLYSVGASAKRLRYASSSGVYTGFSSWSAFPISHMDFWCSPRISGAADGEELFPEPTIISLHAPRGHLGPWFDLTSRLDNERLIHGFKSFEAGRGYEGGGGGEGGFHITSVRG